MHMGAVLITAGLGDAPMELSGDICVARRMIATLQKAGVTTVVVVTGPEDKKPERQLAQSGVLFLHNPVPEDEGRSVRMGMDYLAQHCERVFLLTADRPLLTPQTLLAMAAVDADLVIPLCEGRQGQPFLVRTKAAGALGSISRIASAAAILQPVILPVEDTGVLHQIPGNTDPEAAMAAHDLKLTRPVLELSVCRGKQLFDGKLMALLQRIRQTQSVRDACCQMQVSYSTAWNLLNGAEAALGYPLLQRNKGGPSGTGSLLTPKGQILLDAYLEFEEEAKESVEKLYEKHLQSIL